jgi:hypothetical protein
MDKSSAKAGGCIIRLGVCLYPLCGILTEGALSFWWAKLNDVSSYDRAFPDDCVGWSRWSAA